MVRRHPLFHALGYVANIVLVTSILLIVFGALWEYSTRRYLKGFADAAGRFSFFSWPTRFPAAAPVS